MDHEWAISQLEAYLKFRERVPLPPDEIAPSRKTRPRGSREERTNSENVAQLVSMTIYEEPLRWVTPDAVRRMIWELREGDQVRERLGLVDVPSPRIDVDALHPWVWEAARPHWMADNHGAAVWAASVNVNSRLQQKVERHNLSEGRLVAECFSTTSPEPGRPRLRRCDESNPALFSDMHTGVISFGKGLYSAVRNPLVHVPEAGDHAGEIEHLEALASFSLLARWIDTAVVVRAD